MNKWLTYTRNTVLLGIPLAFIASAAIGLADGKVDGLWQQYELALAERLICVLIMLSLLHWYDRMRGWDENDKRHPIYFGCRIIAVAIILAFGGF